MPFIISDEPSKQQTDQPTNQGRFIISDTLPKQESFGKALYQDVIAPTVEGAGMIAGGIVGSAVSPIAGTVGGAAIGYAGARRLTQGVGQVLGYRQPESIPESFISAGKDMVTGAASEMTGQVTGKVLDAAIPILSKVKNATARKLYESAIKPVPSLKTSVRESAITTGLENTAKGEPYRPTAKHVEQLSENIAKLVEKSDNIVRGAAWTGDSIPTSKLTGVIDDLVKEYNKGPFPAQDIEKLMNFKQELINTHGDFIPVHDALDMKKFIYETAKQYYEKVKTMTPTAIDPIRIHVEKNIARAIRLELENMYPSIIPINKTASQQIEFSKILDRASHRVANTEIFSLYDAISTGAGAVLGGAPGGIGGIILTKMGTNPQMKSLFAKEIYKSRIPVEVKKELLTQIIKLSSIKPIGNEINSASPNQENQ